jgi:hypothetical protein
MPEPIPGDISPVVDSIPYGGNDVCCTATKFLNTRKYFPH